MTDLLIIFFGLTMLYVAATSRLEAYVKMLAFQGAFLFLLTLIDFIEFQKFSMLFVLGETLVFKTIVIPILVLNIIRKNDIFREVEPNISQFSFIVLVSITLVIGFGISFLLARISIAIKPLFFGVSISTIIASLLICVTRKKIITHVIGFLMLENGIFLLSLSVAKEMPLIVNLGVLLDVFAGVFILGMFVTKVKSTFEEMDIDYLSTLKD